MEDQASVAVLHFDDPASIAAASNVLSALAPTGLPARLLPAQTSRADSSSLAIIVLLALPLHSFLKGLGEALGKASGEALASVVRRTVAALPDRGVRPSQSIVLRDADSGTEIELTPDVPVTALNQLTSLRLGTPATVRYDHSSGEWMVISR